ncbi:MAG: ATP-dependent RecD-like DNA helicase [Clostridia bacterium]|nr:ATP-dependent RecD-like DNA helicase [Clostridia bacterium]
MENSVEIKGIVENVTYRNRDNGYTVVKIKAGKEYITAAGIMPYLSDGDSVTLYGDYVVHSVYGRQFRVDAAEVSAPQSQLQVLRFLSSGAIKGVGPSTAAKIVEKFREDTLDVIENSPLELATIRGISEEKAFAISEEYKKQYGVRDIMLALSKFKITPNEAANIFRQLGSNCVELVKSNPYLLCVEGIDFPFERAEEIAESFNISRENTHRLSSGIEFVLRRNLLNGHTCLPRPKLIDVSIKLLDVNRNLLEDTLDKMLDSFLLAEKQIGKEEFIFLNDYAAAEEFSAAKLKALVRNNTPLMPISPVEMKFVEAKLNIAFDKKQIEAVNEAMNSGVFVLTGGPGTGKTTTLNAIISVLSGRGKSIALAAPTGRAAKRMTELTGYEAKTIHRLLEVEWGEQDKITFGKNKKNHLDFDVVIIDEMSMVDILLLRSLLEAIRITTRIIFVGDSDQLPSVGAGNVLSDIINSEVVPFVKLDKVFRQAEESTIVTNAHKIIKGEIPDFKENSSDFFFIRKSSPWAVDQAVLELCTNRLPGVYGLDPMTDIQVLCPSKKLESGTLNLNKILQESLNPYDKKSPEIYYKGIPFRQGDKVMQIKNDYDVSWTKEDGEIGSGVFNGDIGFIREINKRDGLIRVQFDDKIATYFDTDLSLLEHAYAVTVHKSQGSEFDCVILPLIDTPHQLRYRNLLYTAITRAKKLLIVIGSREVFCAMAENDRKTLRYSALSHLLCGDKNEDY